MMINSINRTPESNYEQEEILEVMEREILIGEYLFKKERNFLKRANMWLKLSNYKKLYNQYLIL